MLKACTAAMLIGVMRPPGCPFDSAWCLVCELCRSTVNWVDCRCFLSFVFLGGARRLELSPCNTKLWVVQVSTKNWPYNCWTSPSKPKECCPLTAVKHNDGAYTNSSSSTMWSRGAKAAGCLVFDKCRETNTTRGFSRLVSHRAIATVYFG